MPCLNNERELYEIVCLNYLSGIVQHRCKKGLKLRVNERTFRRDKTNYRWQEVIVEDGGMLVEVRHRDCHQEKVR